MSSFNSVRSRSKASFKLVKFIFNLGDGDQIFYQSHHDLKDPLSVFPVGCKMAVAANISWSRKSWLCPAIEENY